MIKDTILPIHAYIVRREDALRGEGSYGKVQNPQVSLAHSRHLGATSSVPGQDPTDQPGYFLYPALCVADQWSLFPGVGCETKASLPPSASLLWELLGALAGGPSVEKVCCLC